MTSKNTIVDSDSLCEIVGPDIISQNTEQRWFAKFRGGNFRLKNELEEENRHLMWMLLQQH